MIKGKLTFHDPVLNCIRGNFYLPGKKRATPRKLCTFDEAAFEGVGKTRRKRTKAKFRDYVKNLYDKKLIEILWKENAKEPDHDKFKEISKKWMAHVKVVCDKKTVTKYQYSINDWLAANKNHILSEVNQSHLDRLITLQTKRKLSLASQESVLREIKIFLNWAEEQGYIERVPKLVGKKPTKKKIRTYSKEQLADLEDIIRDNIELTKRYKSQYTNHLRSHMMLKLTGMRIGEIWSMELNRIKLDIYPPLLDIKDVEEIGFYVKGGEEQTVPISEKLKTFLLEDLSKRNKNERWYLDDGNGNLDYHDPHAISSSLSKWNKRLGILGVKPAHGYRSTVGTNLAQMKVPTEFTQKLLRHKDRRTTEKHYIDKEVLDIKELVEIL